MFLRSFSSTLRNFKGITRVVNTETSLACGSICQYGRFAPRHPVAIVNEDELFDVEVKNTRNPTPKRVKSQPQVKPKNPKTPIKSFDNLRDGEAFDFESDQYEESSQNRRRFSKAYKNDEDVESEFYPESDDFEAGFFMKSQDAKKSKKPKRKRSQNKEEGETEAPKDDKQFHTKLYENEKTLAAIMLSIKSRKERKKKEQILLEGTRYILDAVKAGMVPEMIIYSRSEDIKCMPQWNKEVKFYKVPYRSIQLWSTLTTPPGVMGIFKKPLPLKISKSSIPLTVICDNVRDPGNMGSILRAAAGIGCEKVLLTKGCVDFWDAKVLRSAAGAHFRVPVFGAQTWEDINSKVSSDALVYVADNNVEPNVSHKNNEEVDENTHEDVDENADEDEHSRESGKDVKFNLQEKMKEFPAVPYFAVDYSKTDAVLIVGGETQGLSISAYKMLRRQDGIRVNIPLDNGIDSLNAGMALGIIGFEIKRQFLSEHKSLEEQNQIAQ
ncbi:hypothetical protein QAD02_018889 [Eretmocerus hayati]|uniref:Uncharacterized protein n=1 Tax=Eretmocerus hayati TaxID=131215 RepID=A0ACC2PL01_9HYME|nr:hypothetical protein QAD02_018889 [Eretmocerus hayati]